MVTYFGIVWQDRDWDQMYLLNLIEFKLRRMAKSQRDGPLVNGPRHGRQMLICAHLCHRLAEDNYPLPPFMERFTPRSLGREICVQKQDLELLTKIFSKHVLCWWT